jgi:hypothetical protein
MFATTSCSTQDVVETCEYASGVRFYLMQPSDLSVLLSAPKLSDTDPPYLILGDSDSSYLAVELTAVEESRDLSEILSDTQCKIGEIREYDLSVTNDDWLGYWSKAKEQGHYSMGFVVPGLESRVRKSSFGFTLVEKSTRELANACGCFGK